MAVAPDGAHAYVAAGAEPVAVSPDGGRVYIAEHGGRVYVAEHGAGRVGVLDTAANAVASHITVGAGPSSVTFSPDGRRDRFDVLV